MHAIAVIFFIVALLGAAVSIHLAVRSNWPEIREALLGQLGRRR